MLFFVLGGGLYLLIYSRAYPLTQIKKAFGLLLKKEEDQGISRFQALSAVLAATVGLGNIAGVAIAISIGGPGATFWMIVAGLLGMSAKFVECTLGVKYRKLDENGEVSGGPCLLYTSPSPRDRG